VLLDKHAHAVKWSVACHCAGLCVARSRALRTDDDQKALAKAFEGATGRDKDRCTVARDLALKTVASL
jgi:ribonuclease H2 subunit A